MESEEEAQRKARVPVMWDEEDSALAQVTFPVQPLRTRFSIE